MTATSLNPEQELMLRLVQVREARADQAELIRELARAVDYERLHTMLVSHKLLSLVGARLLATANGSVPADFRYLVERALQGGRASAALLLQMTDRFTHALEEAGVPVVALKGPALSSRLYGDPALRTSFDVDLLVEPERFHTAREVLAAEGYESPTPRDWTAGLPIFETSLVPQKPWLPPIDLHWRVHWYETGYSGMLVRNAAVGPDGVRELDPIDDLTVMLLIYARDGFHGLRLAGDVAAWWDVHGASLDRPPLDRAVERHPAVAKALRTAVAVVDRVVGVPAERLLSRPNLDGRALTAAQRLANWSYEGDERRRIATVSLVDALLTPSGGSRQYVRRHLLPPRPVIRQLYDIPQGARVRTALRRAWYGSSMTVEFAPRFAAALWQVRGRRELAPVPPAKRNQREQAPLAAPVVSVGAE